MDGPTAANLRIWSGWTRNSAGSLAAPAPVTTRAQLPVSRADEYFAAETMYARGQRNLPAAEPYSLQWYLNIETQRHGRQGKWIPRLLEFAKHAGEIRRRLERARHGLAQYACPVSRSVVACSSSPEHLELTRRNFETRGLKGRFLHTAPDCLPLESASIDVVCVSSFLQEANEPDAIVREIYRVLKPGGKVLGVMPASYDVDFWFGLCFPWTRLFGKRRTRLDCEGQKYSRRRLRRLFHGFVEHRIHQRHLRRYDIPHIYAGPAR